MSTKFQSFGLEQRLLPLQERAIRGSLPLKKRRLYPPPTTTTTLSAFDKKPSARTAPLVLLPEHPISIAPTGEEKIAALALVAAAASAPDDMDFASACQPTSVNRDPRKNQDKRYSGAPDERCCQATTTRGRPCSFVAVMKTKYCHLHADFGEASKRGAQKGSAIEGDSFSIAKIGVKTGSNILIPEPRMPSSMVSSTSPPSVTSEESSSATPARTDKGRKTRGPKRKFSRRSSSIIASLHAESPYPLLSMIPTEKWFGKAVSVAAGPLVKHEGKVEKWGNGWVSVRIPGKGLHNRRAFDLYLLDDEEELSDVMQPASASSIARCVSSEAVSPSPNMIELSPGQQQGSGTLTPKLTLSSPSSAADDDFDEAPRHFVKTSPPGAIKTPRPEKLLGGETKLGPGISSLAAAARKKFAAETADAATEGYAADNDRELAQITPQSPKKTRADVPLVESLLLAAEGGKQHNMDMLFGTAALDRGRRSVHKPARYEDTAMITNHKKSRASSPP